MKASAQAAKKEEEYQSLKLQYEELQQKNNGGSFAAQEHRVGGKRPAEADPHVELNCPDIWSHFIADVTKTGYGVIWLILVCFFDELLYVHKFTF